MGIVRRGVALNLNRRDESVAAAGHCFDIPRGLGRVVQHLPQPRDSRVQTAFVIHEGSARPQARDQFPTTYDLIRSSNKRRQDLKRLLLNLQPQAALTQVGGREIYLKGAETNNGDGWMSLHRLNLIGEL